ncbi:MAG: 3'-5' exonuclease [Planctomycetaceae bacterium]
MIHAADGNIPSDMATDSPDEIEEERRLFYVALTRAKNHLYVTVPQRYYFSSYGRSDSHSYGQPTRFITPHAKQVFQERPAYEQLAEPEQLDRGPHDTSEIRARIKRSW